jgi:transcriptional regulator with XRE-family HTH domain
VVNKEMTVNMKLKNYIKDNGLKFGFVAEKSGIDPKKFSRLINGHQKLTVDEYENICKKGLAVDPSFFLKETSRKVRNNKSIAK